MNSKGHFPHTNKKILIQIYFLIFIILNLFDFFNALNYFFDFFKKLLSWGIIIYIFYIVSFTKISIGERIRTYDTSFLIGFCLMILPKTFYLYLLNLYPQSIRLENFLFDPLFFFLRNYIDEQIIFILLIIAIIICLITSISLLNNRRPLKNSLLGSFNIKDDNYFHRIFEIMSLFLFSLLFGLIIFNFFMEWFAIAIDSIVLVLGLIYYIFLYIHNHGKGKISNYIRDVSNSGNEFYKSLMGYFSNKKTIFIGISFLLTLHLLVDIGVFLFPYILGTENALYFQSLDSIEQEHNSIFSVFSFKNSLFYEDISSTIPPFEILYTLSIFLINIAFFVSFASLMFLPFYIFYNNIKKKTVSFKGKFYAFILSSIIFSIIILTNVFPSIESPLNLSQPKSLTGVQGIDIHSKNVLHEKINPQYYFEIPLSIILYFIIIIFIFYGYQKYSFLFEKIFLLFVLFFFIFYITIFSKSILDSNLKNLEKIGDQMRNPYNYDLKDISILKENSINFSNYYSFYENKRNIKFKVKNKINSENYFDLKLNIFSNISSRDEKDMDNHLDFLMLNFSFNEKTLVHFNNPEKLYLKDIEKYDFDKSEYLENEMILIVKLGNNYFNFENNRLELTEFDSEYFKNLFTIEKKERNPIKFSQYSLIIVNLSFSMIFYIVGMINFVIYFVRKNII
jgi:hypothetical protein